MLRLINENGSLLTPTPLIRSLSEIYQQDVMDIANDIKPWEKAPYPCGSKKCYKHCCMPRG